MNNMIQHILSEGRWYAVPWYCKLSTAGSLVSFGCVCNTTAILPSVVAVLTPMKTSSITWILAAPAGYWLKMVHSWNLPSALSSMEPVDIPIKVCMIKFNNRTNDYENSNSLEVFEGGHTTYYLFC